MPNPQHVQAQVTAQQPAAPVMAAPRPVPVPEPEPVFEDEDIEDEEEEEESFEEADFQEEEDEEEEVEEHEEPATPDLTEEEIRKAFGNEEPEPIESMTDAPPEDRADDDAELDPDKIPDPEPLPESLTSPDDDDFEDEEEESKSRLGLVLAAVGGGLLLVLLAVFILMSKQIASWVPGMAGVYSAIGLNAVTLGEGLEIRNIKSERVTSQKGESLVVRGFIQNTTREKIAVPMIKVALY
ncbi:MAG: hypothetical protein RIB59_00325, partial [Rhodospirillales bacterium]